MARSSRGVFAGKMKYNTNMPIRRLRKVFKKPQPFDWFALLILASFAFIIANVVDNDIQRFGKEMDVEAHNLQADLLAIKTLKNIKD